MPGTPIPPQSGGTAAPRPKITDSITGSFGFGQKADLRGEPGSVERRLYQEGFEFNFFQAVRLLEKLFPDRIPVGYDGPVGQEVVRFRAHVALNFPPSQIYDIRYFDESRVPELSEAFFGLSGITGALPRHYSELILRLERDSKHSERRALRDWFDLFTHRLLSLFYRAWEKYRFYIPYERRQFAEHPPDPFTHALLSISGLGMAKLRHRIRIRRPAAPRESRESATLARVPDLAIMHYAGLLACRPRGAAGLAAMLSDYFQLPVEVCQFQGQWLMLDPADQSQLGADSGNCVLGDSLVIGERVWDVAGKIRLRLGPLGYEEFVELLPDRTPVARSKAFFLLSQLTRLYVGPTLEFDVQLLLRGVDVPAVILGDPTPPGSRLGWNTWLRSSVDRTCAEEAVFEGREIFQLDGSGRA
jgi:type VI secretion system protein ImpH